MAIAEKLKVENIPSNFLKIKSTKNLLLSRTGDEKHYIIYDFYSKNYFLWKSDLNIFKLSNDFDISNITLNDYYIETTYKNKRSKDSKITIYTNSRSFILFYQKRMYFDDVSFNVVMSSTGKRKITSLLPGSTLEFDLVDAIDLNDYKLNLKNTPVDFELYTKYSNLLGRDKMLINTYFDVFKSIEHAENTSANINRKYKLKQASLNVLYAFLNTL